VIGSRANATDTTRWDDTARSLRSVATDIVCRRLTDHHGASDVSVIVRYGHEWLTVQLHSLAEAGLLVSINPNRLGALILDVHAWRIEHHLTDQIDSTTPLGPVPADPLHRARHIQLARRLATVTDHYPGRGIA
jgi:hypothetical protein